MFFEVQWSGHMNNYGNSKTINTIETNEMYEFRSLASDRLMAIQNFLLT